MSYHVNENVSWYTFTIDIGTYIIILYTLRCIVLFDGYYNMAEISNVRK